MGPPVTFLPRTSVLFRVGDVSHRSVPRSLGAACPHGDSCVVCSGFVPGAKNALAAVSPKKIEVLRKNREFRETRPVTRRIRIFRGSCVTTRRRGQLFLRRDRSRRCRNIDRGAFERGRIAPGLCAAGNGR